VRSPLLVLPLAGLAVGCCAVADDNTAGFTCSAAVNDSGTTSWSMHAYGEDTR